MPSFLWKLYYLQKYCLSVSQLVYKIGYSILFIVYHGTDYISQLSDIKYINKVHISTLKSTFCRDKYFKNFYYIQQDIKSKLTNLNIR